MRLARTAMFSVHQFNRPANAWLHPLLRFKNRKHATAEKNKAHFNASRLLEICKECIERSAFAFLAYVNTNYIELNFFFIRSFTWKLPTVKIFQIDATCQIPDCLQGK